MERIGNAAVYKVNAILFLVVEFGLVVFDAVQELGRLHGAAFTIWTLYAGAAFFLVNGVLAIVMGRRDGPARPFVVSAVVVPLVAIVAATVASKVLL